MRRSWPRWRELQQPRWRAISVSCRRARSPLVQTPAPRARADCAAIGHLMLYHSTTMLGRRMGFALLRTLGGDVATSEDKALQRNLEWVLVEDSAGEDSVSTKIRSRCTRTPPIGSISTTSTKSCSATLRRRGLSTDAPSDWQPSEHVSIAQASIALTRC